jgi:hypothetical protein
VAEVRHARLVLHRSKQRKTVRSLASCIIVFTPFEKSELIRGVEFELRCALWGEDPIVSGVFPAVPNDSDHLYEYPRRTIRAGSPTGHRFEETFGLGGVLDEDNGVDEVFAWFTLENMYTHGKAQGISPVAARLHY